MKKRGFSLIEAALVMGVVGLVMGGVWMTLSSVRNASMDRAFLQQTVTLAQNVRTYFATRPLPSTAADVTTYSDFALRAAKVFPEDTCSGNCVLVASLLAKNVFGGNLTFSIPLNGALPSPNRFRISVSASTLSRDHCLAWAIALSSQAKTLGLVRMNLGLNVATFPIKPATVVSAMCSPESSYYYAEFKIRM